MKRLLSLFYQHNQPFHRNNHPPLAQRKTNKKYQRNPQIEGKMYKICTCCFWWKWYVSCDMNVFRPTLWITEENSSFGNLHVSKVVSVVQLYLGHLYSFRLNWWKKKLVARFDEIEKHWLHLGVCPYLKSFTSEVRILLVRGFRVV